MNAVIPERTTETAPAWVLYDGDCAICRNGAERFRHVLEQHGFRLAPLQTPWVRLRFGLAVGQAPAEMLVLTPDGQAWGGADGVMRIARQIWWVWPVFAVSRVPGAMVLFRAIYRQVAVRRYCLGDECAMPVERNEAVGADESAVPKAPRRKCRRVFFEMP